MGQATYIFVVIMKMLTSKEVSIFIVNLHC